MRLSSALIVLLIVGVVQAWSEDVIIPDVAAIDFSTGTEELKREITPESLGGASLPATVDDEATIKRKRRKKISEGSFTKDDQPEKRATDGSSALNALNPDVKRESDVVEPSPSSGAVAFTEDNQLTSKFVRSDTNSPKTSDDVKRDAYVPEYYVPNGLQPAGMTPEMSHMIEKIYEEEQDMKILMQTIVKEEKQMEKMLEKLEQLEARVEAKTMDRSPQLPQHHIPQHHVPPHHSRHHWN